MDRLEKNINIKAIFNMARSIKFKNGTYLDASSIAYTIDNKRFILNSMLRSLYKQPTWDYETTTEKTYGLGGFSGYLITLSNVGNSNLYDHGIWIVLTGQLPSNTSRIVCLYKSSNAFTLTLVDGHTLKITYPSKWHMTTITKLNIF